MLEIAVEGGQHGRVVGLTTLATLGSSACASVDCGLSFVVEQIIHYAIQVAFAEVVHLR